MEKEEPSVKWQQGFCKEAISTIQDAFDESELEEFALSVKKLGIQAKLNEASTFVQNPASPSMDVHLWTKETGRFLQSINASIGLLPKDEKDQCKRLIVGFVGQLLLSYFYNHPLHACEKIKAIQRGLDDKVWQRQYNKEDLDKYFDLTYLKAQYCSEKAVIPDEIDQAVEQDGFLLTWDGEMKDLEELANIAHRKGWISASEDLLAFLNGSTQNEIVVQHKFRYHMVILFDQLIERELLNSEEGKKHLLWATLSKHALKPDGKQLYKEIQKTASKINNGEISKGDGALEEVKELLEDIFPT